MPVVLHHGDCLDIMRTLPDSSVDSIVTDPPYGLGFMGKAWDDLPPGEEWARECLRVLKPGGHLLAFGGTRTWHRLACAVEDAGFEVRDSIAWLYGSGFPKSLDVSKAIDKARTEDLAPAAAVAKWLVDRMAERGLARDDLNRALGLGDHSGGSAQQWTTHWTTGAVKPRVPKWDQWQELRRWMDLPDDMDAEVWRLNGRKGKPGDNFEGREILSERTTSREDDGWAKEAGSGMFQPGDRTIRETAPATPDAERWQGWGTALKPAFEPVVVGRKPLAGTGVNVLAMVESELRNRLQIKEIRWTNGPASGAARPDPQTSSSSTQAPRVAATSADRADVSETPNTARPTASESGPTTRHGEKPTESTSAPTTATSTASSETQCSTPTAAGASAATSDSISSSPSTTSTEAAPPTAKPSTARSTPNSEERATRPATESFAGIATGLTGSRAHVLIKRLPDGYFVWPEGLPSSVPGGALTVAQNVLTHGTGALNIDGCRISGEPWKAHRATGLGSVKYFTEGDAPVIDKEPHTAGRWPANVVLDESQADALDQQSGTLHSQNPATRASKSKRTGVTAMGTGASIEYADKGGASRFFYVAKAPKRERPRTDDGTAHPTVKPLALMRWLVRLVTPPGGTVLEPFAGSGTTVEACILEGFDCIAIEREADYLPLIETRIERASA